VTKAEPLPGEQLVMKLKPHPLAFWHLFVVSGLLIVLGYLLRQLYVFVAGFKLRISLPLLQQYNVANILILWGMLIGVAIIVGLIYIRVTSLLAFGAVALVATILTEYFKMPLEIHFWVLVISGFMGLSLTEFYRRGHNYYITNLRLITEKDFVSYDSRQLTYDKINDLALVQGLIGRILNFGTVIPVTASGFGLGKDSASAGIGAGIGTGSGAPLLPGVGLLASGERAVHIPRGRTYHTLYGDRRPREVQETIAKMIQKQMSGSRLERIASGVEKLLSQNMVTGKG